MQFLHIGLRAWCSAQVYGWKFASAVPLRVLWGNWINLRATASAIRRFSWARLRGQPLVWLKTEHAYPNRAALVEHRLKLGEILTGSGYVSNEDMEEALRTQPAGVRIGEWLVQGGQLTLEHLYEALSLQQNVPLGKPAADEISVAATRILPAHVARELSIIPFRVVAGQLYVAGTDFPDERTSNRIAAFCPLTIRFHLVIPEEFEQLTEEYLPALAKRVAM